MKLILDSWQLRWRSVLFDTCTGRGKVRWFAKRSEVNNGWANKFEGTWYALWKQGDHLIFQVGEKSWNMGSCKCFHRSQGVMSVFEIHRLEEIEFSLRYVRDWLVVDQLDLETTDFFYWVNVVCNNANLQTGLRSQ